MKVLKTFSGKKLENYPQLVYSNLYKRVLDNVHFEFSTKKEKILFSPLYTLLRGDAPPDLVDFVTNNETFLDSLKEFIINSLFFYSAIIEVNSYHLSNPQSIMIIRLSHNTDQKFEVKFYTHFQDELLDAYKDKIYIGRDFIDLERFEREHLGLVNNFASLTLQNKKIQERAKNKLRYYDDYKKPYLDEINYLINETSSDSRERITLFPGPSIAKIPKVKLNQVLDNILYLQNLLIELKDFLHEFEEKLRLGEENNFVKYLIKFAKDIDDDIIYLRKLSFQVHLKISNFLVCD